MTKTCIHCGRPIRTGTKFCYVCRSIQHAKGKTKVSVFSEKNFFAWTIGIGGLVAGIYFYFINDEFAHVLGFIGLFVGTMILIVLIPRAILEIIKKRKNLVNQRAM